MRLVAAARAGNGAACVRRFDTGPLQRERVASDAHLERQPEMTRSLRGRADIRPRVNRSSSLRRRDGGSERWRDCESDGFWSVAKKSGVLAADLARLATRPSFRRLRSSVSARQLFSARKCTHATTWAVKATLGVQCEPRRRARDQKMAKDCGQGSALVIFCASSRARLDMARDGRGRRASRPALV